MAKRVDNRVYDWGLIADERINPKIDLNKIKSKDDYKSAVKDLIGNNPQGQTLLRFLDEMFEESKASEIVKKNSLENEELKARALVFELRRKRASRVADESKTSRVTRPVNRENYRKWRRTYRRTDLQGIDTKRPTRKIGVRTLNRISITQADRRLSSGTRPWINLRNRRKEYRDSSGRFTQSPFRRKFKK